MLSCQKLLGDYRATKNVKNAQRIDFKGVGNKDVYNISAPFAFDGKEFILGRVEPRDSEYSEIFFFEKESSGVYNLANDYPTFDMQDPFFTFIDGELILGGVEVSPKENKPTELEWRTIFYKILSATKVEKVFSGPIGMKDLRFKQLQDGKILVLTRPQGEKGGRGKIGYFIAASLADITAQQVMDAPLLANQFSDDEWGGANEIYLLDEQHVGVLAHIANFDEAGDRHYYAMTFELDLTDFIITNPQIIAERQDFLVGPTKRPDLADVVFSGGLVLAESSELYVGISDADAQKITIDNPFFKEGK